MRDLGEQCDILQTKYIPIVSINQDKATQRRRVTQPENEKMPLRECILRKRFQVRLEILQFIEDNRGVTKSSMQDTALGQCLLPDGCGQDGKASGGNYMSGRSGIWLKQDETHSTTGDELQRFIHNALQQAVELK